MKRVLVILIAAAVLISWSKVVSAEVSWQEVSRGVVNVNTVLTTKEERVIFIGTDKGVYKSEDAGGDWRSVLSIRGDNKRINLLISDPNQKSLYAATGDGLFLSNNLGSNWKRVFRGKNYFENECTSFAILPHGFYLGTRQGLFVSRDRGRSWQRETGKIGNAKILNIAYSDAQPNYVYVASVYGVFKTQDAGKSWDRVFFSNPSENGIEKEEVIEDSDEDEKFSDIRYVVVDKNDPNILYLATDDTIYVSRDSAKTWLALTDYGLLSREINYLTISDKSELLAITKSGLFVYENTRWRELSLNLAVNQINSIALGKDNNIYAACDKGLFVGKIEYSEKSKNNDICSAYFEGEPEISEIQEAAIKYAEVEPEKIMRWRKQAAKRALLPRLSVGMDIDKDTTTSKSIWGTYSSFSNGNVTAPERCFIGPDDVTRYNNKNWGVTLTWELGDLIWNNDQTSIDVRSRLMVQLREDILDEVTKIYFERLRVKMELDNLSIEDRKKRFEKELRLAELTASIDALTGGYYSSFKKRVHN